MNKNIFIRLFLVINLSGCLFGMNRSTRLDEIYPFASNRRFFATQKVNNGLYFVFLARCSHLQGNISDEASFNINNLDWDKVVFAAKSQVRGPTF